jgi:hypothetical protein
MFAERWLTDTAAAACIEAPVGLRSVRLLMLCETTVGLPAVAILREMDARDRVIGPIATVTERDGNGIPLATAVDFGSLVRKLVLCEQIIVQSQQVSELPTGGTT